MIKLKEYLKSIWVKVDEWIFWLARVSPCEYNQRHFLDWWYLCLILVGYPYMLVLLYMFFWAPQAAFIWKLSPLVNGEFGIGLYDGTVAAYSYFNAKVKINGCANGKKRAGQYMILWWGLVSLAMLVSMIFWSPFNLEGPPATAFTNFGASLLALLFSRSKKIQKGLFNK